MTDFDRSYERSWFRVYIGIGSMAAFVVRSYTEESAFLKVDYWLQANPKIGLKIDTEETLPLHAEWAKPLDPLEHRYYDTLGDEICPVRLVKDHRSLPLNEARASYTGMNPNQLGLFAVADYAEIVQSQK